MGKGALLGKLLDMIMGTPWIWTRSTMADPHGREASEDARTTEVTRRERNAEEITCATIVENPDIEPENANSRLTDCI